MPSPSARWRAVRLIFTNIRAMAASSCCSPARDRSSSPARRFSTACGMSKPRRPRDRRASRAVFRRSSGYAKARAMSRISGRPAISTEHVYGLSLRVPRLREGAPGTPLLFLNGIGADIAAAAPLLAQIDGRGVWTLDMPGVGGSPDALLPYGAPTIAAVVMEIADRLGHKTIEVAGFSWGGALAQQGAIRSEEHTSELQ